MLFLITLTGVFELLVLLLESKDGASPTWDLTLVVTTPKSINPISSRAWVTDIVISLLVSKKDSNCDFWMFFLV